MALLLGLVGMGGVFLGLVLLSVCLFYMPHVLSRLGYDEPEAKPEPASTPPATGTPALPSAAEPQAVEAVAAEGSASPVDPWRLAQGPLGEPGAAGWIRPAFRAAFQGASKPAPPEAEVTVSGKPFRVSFLSLDGSRARVSVNGREMDLDLGDLPDVPMAWATAPLPAALRPAPKPALRPKAAAPRPAPARPSAKPAPASAEAEPGGMVAIRAPIPGTIKSIAVKAGDAVTRGQLVLLLEAMKMDNEICSPSDGTVQEIRAQAKDPVRQGDILILVKP